MSADSGGSWRRRRVIVAVVLFLGVGATGFILPSCRHGEPEHPDPQATEVEHPFLGSMKGVATGSSPPAEPNGQRTRAPGLVATNLVQHTFPRPDLPNGVTLMATPEVPKEDLAQLVLTARFVEIPPQATSEVLKALAQGQQAELQAGMPEVRWPLISQQKLTHVSSNYLGWTDAWQMVRPGVLRLIEKGGPPGASGGGDVGVATAALTGSWTRVVGSLSCMPPSQPRNPLPFVTVQVGGVSGPVDSTGAFAVNGRFTEITSIRVIYDGPVAAGGATSAMTVMNDGHEPRHEDIDTPTGGPSTGTLNLGTLTAVSLDCELFRIGADSLTSYHGITGISPPAGRYRIKRWSGDLVSGPYTFFDYSSFPTDYLTDTGTTIGERTDTVFHEFGHSVRHVADGGEAHWNGDNFVFAYARVHSGREIFNEQTAFNEGWANYWACTRPGAVCGRLPRPVTLACPTIPTDANGVPTSNFLDWNEIRIGQRLLDLAAALPTSHGGMDAIQRSRPGGIHTLADFERAYCAAAGTPVPSAICDAARTPVRLATKPACPPCFADHGLTCYQPDVVAKPSGVRGVGTLPLGCGPELENDAGLCYAECPAGFDGVGPVCWQDCPAGMHDDGAFCRRDVEIRASDNSACPWWDVCGVTFAAGCSTCPAGFHNDGCTCRRDAWIFAKATSTRGVGTIPRDCGAGREYDAGLCYPRCPAGQTGVGPVCWGSCPAGFEDHGATCWRAPNIIIKP